MGRRCDRAEKEMKEVDRTVHGRVGKVWEMKKRIIGGNKSCMEATAMINPATGKLAVTKEEVIKVSINSCKETLKNNEPKEEFKEEIERKKKEMKDYLNERGGQFKANKDTFENMLNKFRKSGKRNYDCITKESKGLQDAVFSFCERMFEEEEFPQEFQNTTLHMIFKGGKGRKENLSDS